MQQWVSNDMVTVRRAGTVFASVLLALGATSSVRVLADAAKPYGMDKRVVPPAYLHMPHQEDGPLPKLLSQTGAFSDLKNLVPAPGLMNYELVVPFWSDRAVKTRWVAVPSEKIKFSTDGTWTFPKGNVFVKTFELPTDASDPTVKRRLETRFLVSDSAGGVYGVTYKWRPDHSDADLLTTSVTEDIPVKDANGQVHNQTWYYPSRQDCHTCHNPRAGGVLGVKTRQMNRDITYPTGVTDNELRTWNHLGLFSPGFNEQDIAHFVTLAATDDTSRTLEDRGRSYLDANCSHCHQPGGTVANFDARYSTPLDQQQLINGPILIDQGIDRPRVISPHDPWRSILYMRIDTDGDIRMPPLARETIDEHGVALIKQWIESLPGRDVLDPPAMSPNGGNFTGPVAITLSERVPGAEIRYTLDGSVPGPSDALYDKPIQITGPTVLRTRAYKEGLTRSITAQQVYIIGQ
jgi:uncharacterized repeat protein (TIGR03806 family)